MLTNFFYAHTALARYQVAPDAHINARDIVTRIVYGDKDPKTAVVSITAIKPEVHAWFTMAVAKIMDR